MRYEVNGRHGEGCRNFALHVFDAGGHELTHVFAADTESGELEMHDLTGPGLTRKTVASPGFTLKCERCGFEDRHVPVCSSCGVRDGALRAGYRGGKRAVHLERRADGTFTCSLCTSVAAIPVVDARPPHLFIGGTSNHCVICEQDNPTGPCVREPNGTQDLERLLGLRVTADPAVPTSEVRLIEPDTGEVKGRIVNVAIEPGPGKGGEG